VKPAVLNFPKDLIVFFLSPFVHWEQLATSGMVDLHTLPGPPTGRPSTFPTLVSAVRLSQSWKNVVMEMLRPVPSAYVLGFGVMKSRVLIGACVLGLRSVPLARPGYA
jgi:hypothetical protein